MPTHQIQCPRVWLCQGGEGLVHNSRLLCRVPLLLLYIVAQTQSSNFAAVQYIHDLPAKLGRTFDFWVNLSGWRRACRRKRVRFNWASSRWNALELCTCKEQAMILKANYTSYLQQVKHQSAVHVVMGKSIQPCLCYTGVQ